MAVIDDVMATYEDYTLVKLALEHRELQSRSPESRLNQDINKLAAIKLIMWQSDAKAVSAEWACEVCAAANQPCLRMTIAGLIEFVVRDQEVIFLREYAWNCMCCIRRKVKCIVRKRVVNDAYPAGIECTFTRFGCSHPALVVPKRGLALPKQKVTRDHAEHVQPLLGYDEATVKRYVDSLRRKITDDEAGRLTPRDLQALKSRGSIDAFVRNRRTVIQSLFDEYTSMAAGMKPLLNHATNKHQSKSTAAAVCRDLSKTLVKSVCKMLRICPDLELREVDEHGDQLVAYRVDRRHTASFLRRVAVMLAEEALSSEEEDMDVDDAGEGA